MRPYFKVIAISIEVFESTIVDERHFASKEEAEAFQHGLSDNVVAVVIQM